MRFAIYTRKSTEEGLTQEFNSLDAQREAAEAYILSQRHAGWMALPEHYDDAGYTERTWNVRHFDACSPTSKPEKSTQCSSTRWID